MVSVLEYPTEMHDMAYMCSSCACELANCFRQGSTGYDVLSVRGQFSTDHLFGLVWEDIETLSAAGNI